MSWNGHPVIDLDAHIVECADRDASRGRRRAAAGTRCLAAVPRSSSPWKPAWPLGVRDTFRLTQRSGIGGGRKAFPLGRADALPPSGPR